jgi:transmembrane sensor
MKPSLNKINQEACAWIARLHDSEPSPQELAELREWMQQSPAHRSEIRLMAKMWSNLNILTELAVPVEIPKIRASNARSILINLFGGRATAGVFASAVALLLLFFVWQPFNSPGKTTPSSATYSTVIGEQNLVVLADNSTVFLNTNSQVTVDYSDQSRNIYLNRGEAHFDVAKNLNRPFQVYVGGGVVRAVGTAFSVRLKENIVDVTVVAGSVQITAIKATTDAGQILADDVKSPLVVKSGQSALYDQVAGSVALVKVIDQLEISDKLAWREGMLHFSGDPLSQVIDEISRYTPVSIVIKDPELRDLRIGGLFQVGETGKMFDALERSFGVRVEYAENDVIYLSMAAPSTSEN